ncbi:MAG: GntP family permease [Verrucomicrobiales bacterium]|nr:GntP family permease [Verrucomicrobiales bacterium]
MDPFLLLLIGLATVLGGILWLRLHPFIALFIAALLIASITPKTQVANALADKKINERVKLTGADLTEIEQAQIKNDQADYANNRTPIQRITQEFGVTFGKIGLVIALACLIGRCLLASGAADRIVRAALSMVGEKGAPVAFLGSGFALGIPVFFDSLFLLAIPLAKAMWLKLRKNYLLLIVAIIAGGSMTHSLVPPTPGPLYVASALGINIGTMILAGLVVGLFTASAGYLYGVWLNRRMDIPFRETPEAIEKLESHSAKETHELPSLFASLLPIVLPVLLIAGGTLIAQTEASMGLKNLFKLLGDKNIALAIAAGLALFTLARHLKNKKEFTEQMQGALQEAGLIILICCAGGAFGAILLQTGIGPHLQSKVGEGANSLWLLPLAFLVTTVIRAAQGSATVAMITAVGIVGSFAVGNLDYHPVYLALAIGCGSKPLPWMNDSGFWVISKMSGMTEKETLLTFTATLSIMGVTGIVVTMIGAKLFPMV